LSFSRPGLLADPRGIALVAADRDAEGPGAGHVAEAGEAGDDRGARVFAERDGEGSPEYLGLVTAPSRPAGRRRPGQMPYGDGTAASLGATTPCHGS
jgi:hypothetical protein